VGLKKTRGISIGYLPQEGLQLAGRTVFEECLTVFDEFHEMEREIEQLAGQMAELDHQGAQYQSVAERYSLLQDRFHGARRLRARCASGERAHRPWIWQGGLGAAD